jgi:hypothetical protein
MNIVNTKEHISIAALTNHLSEALYYEIVNLSHDIKVYYDN